MLITLSKYNKKWHKNDIALLIKYRLKKGGN